MQVALAAAIVVDLEDECPFDHELEDPPVVNNKLVGKGAKLATSMNNGSSTKLYKEYAPKDKSEKEIFGLIPQKNPDHEFFRGRPDKGRCVKIEFDDNTSKSYPVSCSAHHLIPSQESLKDHDLLQYMVMQGGGGEDNHDFSEGAVWSDVGYDTNGSENGVYLPGNYAVGGGTGGLRVWYSMDDADDEEHDTAYIEVDVLPPEEYKNFLIYGKKGSISTRNACWHYVSQAMLATPGQFHDRHKEYSEQVVQKALTKIFSKYKRSDIVINEGACSKCEERRKKIEEQGLPAPYSVVNRLETLSKKLRRHLTAKPGSWRENIFTSEWCNQYMQAVLKGGDEREEAEHFEN